MNLSGGHQTRAQYTGTTVFDLDLDLNDKPQLIALTVCSFLLDVYRMNECFMPH